MAETTHVRAPGSRTPYPVPLNPHCGREVLVNHGGDTIIGRTATGQPIMLAVKCDRAPGHTGPHSGPLCGTWE